MSYSVFRASKRWTPLNTISKHVPLKTSKRADKHNDGKVAAKRLAFEKKKFLQLMNEMRAHETDVVALRADNDKEAQHLTEKKAGEKEEVAQVNLKEEASDDAVEDFDEDCHYGLLMCMSF